MTVRLTYAAGFSISLALLACSRPAPGPEAQRDIRLIEEPSADSRTVSDLEAGRPNASVAPIPRKAARARIPSPVKSSAPAPAVAVEIMEASPTIQVTTTAQVPAVLEEVPMPAPRGPAPAAEGEGSDGRSAFPGESRGPILIRGGMGTARDDCKIHGMGGLGQLGGHNGIAINRATPPLRGAGGGMRGGGGGGFRP